MHQQLPLHRYVNCTLHQQKFDEEIGLQSHSACHMNDPHGQATNLSGLAPMYGCETNLPTLLRIVQLPQQQ